MLTYLYIQTLCSLISFHCMRNCSLKFFSISCSLFALLSCSFLLRVDAFICLLCVSPLLTACSSLGPKCVMRGLLPSLQPKPCLSLFSTVFTGNFLPWPSGPSPFSLSQPPLTSNWKPLFDSGKPYVVPFTGCPTLALNKWTVDELCFSSGGVTERSFTDLAVECLSFCWACWFGCRVCSRLAVQKQQLAHFVMVCPVCDIKCSFASAIAHWNTCTMLQKEANHAFVSSMCGAHQSSPAKAIPGIHFDPTLQVFSYFSYVAFLAAVKHAVDHMSHVVFCQALQHIFLWALLASHTCLHLCVWSFITVALFAKGRKRWWLRHFLGHKCILFI